MIIATPFLNLHPYLQLFLPNHEFLVQVQNLAMLWSKRREKEAGSRATSAPESGTAWI